LALLISLITLTIFYNAKLLLVNQIPRAKAFRSGSNSLREEGYI